MMVATDHEAFSVMHGVGELPLHWSPFWPGHPETVYTPYEDLPASVRELYDYDPAKARQMLADAGYPNGFSTKLNVGSANPLWQDFMALLKAQWEEVGVETEIVIRDPSAHNKIKYEQTYTGVLAQNWETGNLIAALSRFQTGTTMNFGAWYDDTFDAMVSRMTAEILTDAETEAIAKEAAVYMAGQVPAIPLSATPEAVYWWPWLKNYYGEINILDRSMGREVIGYCWIDQDLKAEMGY
jgi:peptide/nickel transport system substrate-binding protein